MKAVAQALVTGMLSGLLWSGTIAASAEPLWLPGGDEVKQAVAARQGKTELSKLAAAMEPGTWAELKTSMPKGLWNAPSAKRLHIGTWSDDAHWDSRTGQFLFFGVRQARKFVAYSEVSNAWHVIEFEGVTNAPAVPQQFGHQYSGNAFDPERSHYYTKGRRYNVVSGDWSVIPTWKKQSREKAQVISWSSGMDGLFVLIFQDPGQVRLYTEKTKTWAPVAKIPVHGYHSLARDNPFRREVLFAGGNNSQAVVVVRADGSFLQLKDHPAEAVTIRHSIVTVDPLSGRYLFMAPGKTFLELDSEKNEYRLIDDFTETPYPFTRHDAPLVAFIPEYGVSMWADSKVWLYKHDAARELKVVE